MARISLNMTRDERVGTIVVLVIMMIAIAVVAFVKTKPAQMPSDVNLEEIHDVRAFISQADTFKVQYIKKPKVKHTSKKKVNNNYHKKEHADRQQLPVPIDEE